MEPINLDDESEVENFLAKYGTTKGRRLANLLGLKGKGSVKAANGLSNYAWNKSTAMKLRKEGFIARAMQYEEICDRIHKNLPNHLVW